LIVKYVVTVVAVVPEVANSIEVAGTPPVVAAADVFPATVVPALKTPITD
jgi:hypothetical protein